MKANFQLTTQATLKTLTILITISNTYDWVWNEPFHEDTTQVIKLKRRYFSDGKLRWNLFNQLSPFEVQIS